MNVTHVENDGWKITTTKTLTDDEAQAITFQAAPEQVTLGEFVSVEDAFGIRIGHVKTAEYFERAFGPAFVTVGVNLR